MAYLPHPIAHVLGTGPSMTSWPESSGVTIITALQHSSAGFYYSVEDLFPREIDVAVRSAWETRGNFKAVKAWLHELRRW